MKSLWQQTENIKREQNGCEYHQQYYKKSYGIFSLGLSLSMAELCEDNSIFGKRGETTVYTEIF